jgi:hypothetical protein
MTRNTSNRIMAAGVVSLAVATGGLIFGFGSISGATDVALPYGATYQSLPRNLVSLGGVQLDQLDTNQAASVTITAAQALATAKTYVGRDLTSQAGVTDVVSLGSFTDSSFKQLRASGSYSLVASDLASYVVTFSGLSLPTLDGNGVVSHDSVVVNSATGNVIEGIKFY